MKTNGARSAAWVLGAMGLLLTGVFACGSDKKDDNSSTDKKYTFTTDVDPILKASCSSNGACHAVGTKESLQFVGNEAVFKGSSATTRMNLATTSAQYMPLQRSGETHTLSATDKQILIDFLAQ